MSDRDRPDSDRHTGSLLDLALARVARRHAQQDTTDAPRPETLARPATAPLEEDPPAAGIGFWSAVKGSGRLIAAMTIAGTLFGVAVALTTPKVYIATTELLVETGEPGGGEDGMPSEAAKRVVDRQLRLMTSPAALARVAERLGLASDPAFTVSSGYLSALRRILTGAPQDRPAERVAASLARRVAVTRDASMVTVSVRARDPVQAAEIANAIVDVHLDEMDRQAAEAAGRAAEEIRVRLETLRRSVEEAERKVAAFRAEKDLFGTDGNLLIESDIAALGQQLAEARERSSEARARFEALSRIDADRLASLPADLLTPALAELQARHGALAREAQRLATALGPLHPRRRSVEIELGQLRVDIGTELARLAATLEAEMQKASEREQQIADRLAALKARLAGAGDDLVTLRELERAAEAERAVYEAFVERARQESARQHQRDSSISVLSRAEPPVIASGPSRTLISLSGLLLGLLAGTALAGWRGARAVAPPREQKGVAAHVMPDTRPEDADPYEELRDQIRAVRRALADLARIEGHPRGSQS